ncbi:MAG: transcription termination factor NusA [Oscillospiraceae bacterium]|nr:transcription termination factor NusA [Oscillospiraceae bacterium]MDD6146654.1 transcription termination factor NusA [Oscillospiraceae bacterium]
MNKEFFEAVQLLETEKGISSEYIFEKIKAAIISATKNTYGNRDNVVCEIDPEKQTMDVYVRIAVVDEVEEPAAEMTLEQARNYDPNAQVGGFVDITLEPKKFGRIVAQTAKSVIRQGIREAERELANKEFQNRHQEVVTAKINIVYPDTGDASIEIGRANAILPKSEQIPGEVLSAGQLIKVYVSSPKEDSGMSYAHISRKHPGLVKRLFETEVPEIYDGTVEIVSVSREAGSRTKIAVNSHDDNVDAVGACIGPRGQRVSNIVDILCGEKIDIVRYSEDPEKYIAAALAPAEVLSVIPDENGAKTCKVIVPDSQLSLAIGNKGQNVRLAAKLTGWKIDIKPLSAAGE